MLSQTFLNRKAGYGSILNERCSKTIWNFQDVMPNIVDALLMLTFEVTIETYSQSLGPQQFYIISIQSFLAASIRFVCIIIRIKNRRDISVSEPPLYMSFA